MKNLLPKKITHKIKYLLVCILCIGHIYENAAQPVKVEKKLEAPSKKLVFSDDFENGLDTLSWISEIEALPGSSVMVAGGKLVLNTRGGVTVWLNKKLKGNILIEYNRTIKSGNGENNRISDMNQFWMAHDPVNNNLFTRNGKFESYDSLMLYYTGIGGNTNTTTRFRKYTGDGNKVLLQEYTDKQHLLKADHTYHIKIVVERNTTSFYVDGICYFTFTDPTILQEGYFGFRSTYSHQEIDDVRIYEF